MSFLGSNLIQILRNSAATVFVRGASGVARILVLLLIAKRYGASEFGQVTLALSIIEILRVFADAGVDITSIRRLAADAERRATIFHTILTWKLIVGSGAAVLAPFIYRAILGHTGGLLTLLALLPSVVTGLLFTGFVGYFQSQLRVGELLRGNIVGMSVFVALALGAMVLQLPIWWLVIAMPVGELVSVWIFARVYRRTHTLQLERNWAMLKTLLLESIPAGIGGILVVIYLRLDNMMIGWFLGEAQIGQYAFAFRLTEPFSLVLSSLALSLYASLSRRWNTAEESENRRTMIHVMTIALGTATVGFLTTVALRSLIPVVAPAYAPSADVVLIMGATLFVRGVNPQLTAILNSLGKFRIITSITAVNLLVALSLNAVLIPRYAIVGAALTVLVMEAGNTVLQTAALVYYLKHRFALRSQT